MQGNHWPVDDIDIVLFWRANIVKVNISTQRSILCILQLWLCILPSLDDDDNQLNGRAGQQKTMEDDAEGGTRPIRRGATQFLQTNAI